MVTKIRENAQIILKIWCFYYAKWSKCAQLCVFHGIPSRGKRLL